MSVVETMPMETPRNRGSSLPPESTMVGRTPPATPKKTGGKMLAVKMLMLDDTYTLFQIQNKALGAVLLEQTCRQLNLLESDYFGLEYTDGSTRYWLDLDKPMNRQVCLSQVEPVLRFCVKFYTPDPAQLEEEYTRYLFALQIKRDLAHGELLCNENTAACLASYIVQAECGDYAEEDYPDHRYLSLFKFIPTQDSELERKIMENHKKHIGMSPGTADLNLLETARRCELYGIKMHPAKDHENVALNLSVANMGVLVFQGCTKINTFSWAKIRKISFKRKKFLIKLHPEGYLPYGGRWPEGYYKDVVEFFFDGRNECKNFWKKCVEHHGFFRCSSVKKIPRQKTRVMSRGSSFRYSGRTQKQVQEFIRENFIKRQHPFQRSQSFRHSPSLQTNVGMSVSATPLIPIGNNQCSGTPVSLSCGSMTLTSADPQSPVSPTRQDYDPRELETPSGHGTLSPDASLPSSPHRMNDYHQGQHYSSHRRHFQRAFDTNSTRHHSSHSYSTLIDTPLKEYSSYLEDRNYLDNDDSGDNLSHDSYELLERELEEGMSWKGSELGSLIGGLGSIGSKSILSSQELLNSGELEWCESKGGGDMVRGSGHTSSLPRSHGSSSSKRPSNGFTGSLPRTHSISQASDLSRSLAGSRASSRITLEIPLEPVVQIIDDELSSAGSPEFHENSVCEITSEKGYLLSARHLGSITISDNTTPPMTQLNSRRNVTHDDSLADAPPLKSRSRSSSHSRLPRDSHENLTKDDTSISMTMSRHSASVRAAKQVGQYVDYGSSQESIHKISSCESDIGSSVSSQTRSSTTPRPMEFHSTKFLPTRRSTSTSPPSITSGSSQQFPTPVRPHSMDFSMFHKKAMFHVYNAGRGSDSGGNTDSDICSPLEIPPPMPPPEKVPEVDEEEDLTPSQEQVQFLARPADLDLITRIRGSSDEEDATHQPYSMIEEDKQEEDDAPFYDDYIHQDAQMPILTNEDLMETSSPGQEDQILVVIDDKPHSTYVYDFERFNPPEFKEESPSSEMEVSITETISRERKIDESDASERTVIERFRLPDDRLNKLGSKDSQMSIEEIDEVISDRRSSLGHDRRLPSQEASRRSPFPPERRQSYHDLEHFLPQSPRDRRPSSHDGDRRSPYLEADRRSITLDMGRRSPFDRERKLSNSSSRRSSFSSEHRSSVSSERRGSSSSDRRPSLSDIGRRTSISYEPGQRSPFFDAPVFEFDSEKPVFEPEYQTPLSRSPGYEKEKAILYFDGIMLDDREEFIDALRQPEEEQFSSSSGAHVVEVVEGIVEHSVAPKAKDIEIINIEQDEEHLEVQILRKKPKPSPKVKPRTLLKQKQDLPMEPISKQELEILIKEDNDKSEENVNADLSDDVFLTEKETSYDVTQDSCRGPKDSVSSAISPLPAEDKPMEHLKAELLGAVGGSSAEDEEIDHDDFYDDEDDHAQMSDHSSQSPDLVSEPDEYPDEYQEPEYYQQFNRQIDVGFAFPSRTLSRISERSTTSEQEHEQDHIREPEQSDSKSSTPTEGKPSSIVSEEQQGEVPSDLSNSTSEDNHVAKPVASTLTEEEQQNANQFATQLFLRDLPDFVGDGSDDEFPSPPSSAFLENPHTELTYIETYYMEINQRASHSSKNTSEGIYDNIPLKFEGIHEVSESESASEENHTLQEPGSDNEDQANEPDSLHSTTPTKNIESPQSPPPPPPPRPLQKLPSMSQSPTPPLTPPTPIAPPKDSILSSGSGHVFSDQPPPTVTLSFSPPQEDNEWINI